MLERPPRLCGYAVLAPVRGARPARVVPPPRSDRSGASDRRLRGAQFIIRFQTTRQASKGGGGEARGRVSSGNERAPKPAAVRIEDRETRRGRAADAGLASDDRARRPAETHRDFGSISNARVDRLCRPSRRGDAGRASAHASNPTRAALRARVHLPSPAFPRAPSGAEPPRRHPPMASAWTPFRPRRRRPRAPRGGPEARLRRAPRRARDSGIGATMRVAAWSVFRGSRRARSETASPSAVRSAAARSSRSAARGGRRASLAARLGNLSGTPAAARTPRARAGADKSWVPAAAGARGPGRARSSRSRRRRDGRRDDRAAIRSIRVGVAARPGDARAATPRGRTGSAPRSPRRCSPVAHGVRALGAEHVAPLVWWQVAASTAAGALMASPCAGARQPGGVGEASFPALARVAFGVQGARLVIALRAVLGLALTARTALPPASTGDDALWGEVSYVFFDGAPLPVRNGARRGVEALLARRAASRRARQVAGQAVRALGRLAAVTAAAYAAWSWNAGDAARCGPPPPRGPERRARGAGGARRRGRRARARAAAGASGGRADGVRHVSNDAGRAVVPDYAQRMTTPGRRPTLARARGPARLRRRRGARRGRSLAQAPNLALYSALLVACLVTNAATNVVGPMTWVKQGAGRRAVERRGEPTRLTPRSPRSPRTRCCPRRRWWRTRRGRWAPARCSSRPRRACARTTGCAATAWWTATRCRRRRRRPYAAPAGPTTAPSPRSSRGWCRRALVVRLEHRRGPRGEERGRAHPAVGDGLASARCSGGSCSTRRTRARSRAATAFVAYVALTRDVRARVARRGARGGGGARRGRARARASARAPPPRRRRAAEMAKYVDGGAGRAHARRRAARRGGPFRRVLLRRGHRVPRGVQGGDGGGNRGHHGDASEAPPRERPTSRRRSAPGRPPRPTSTTERRPQRGAPVRNDAAERIKQACSRRARGVPQETRPFSAGARRKAR